MADVQRIKIERWRDLPVDDLDDGVPTMAA